MLKSEMQHQFWVTKKAFQRRLGTKEDECIVSSDAELDAKIELFKSISESCGHLYRIIDHYQERLCILAQEENALGKFLKETGKNSNTTGKVMQSTGKAISYCGQQRMTIRPSLLRLHHEVETFRGRAIADTHATIVIMEKERTEYRAALSWMKSVSNQLDPDTGRGVDKFRKAQTHVRVAKTKFDRLALDCLQKIDLLAAARCNMFSHTLVAYMAALLHYAIKTSETFKATAKALSASPQYNFCILKDLTQAPVEEVPEERKDVTPLDSDQMLFFLDDYKDDKIETKNAETKPQQQESEAAKQPTLIPALIDISTSEETTSELKATTSLLDKLDNSSDNQNAGPLPPPSTTTNNINNSEKTTLEQLLGLGDDFGDFVSSQSEPLSFMPSQLLLGEEINTIMNAEATKPDLENHSVPENKNDSSDVPKNKNSILDFFNIPSLNKQNTSGASANNNDTNQPKTSSTGGMPKSKDKNGRKDMSAWFHLFAELDPLANPDAMARKIDGGKDNSQAA